MFLRGVGGWLVAVTVLACLAAPAGATPVATPSVTWTRVFGVDQSDTYDWISDVDATANGTFVVGSQYESPSIFLRRYRANGTVAWDRVLGGSLDSPVPDSLDVYGDSVYALYSANAGGYYDGYLTKYSTDGTRRWTRTIRSALHDYVNEVKATANGVYVGGATDGKIGSTAPQGQGDGFLMRYSHAGARQWVRQFGTAGDEFVNGLAITSSGVVVAGDTASAFPGHNSAGGVDGFIRMYAFDGTHRWTRQFGSANADEVSDAVVHDGAIYVVGETSGRLGPTDAGGSDAFIRKFGADGSTKWTRQFGGAERDGAYAVEAAGDSIYVAGETRTAIPGGQNHGYFDAFVRRYSPSGGVSWTHQFGGAGADTAYAVDASSSGVYVGGAMQGDAFLRRAVSYRPDGAISRSGSSGFVGNDLYNATSSGQTVGAQAARGTRRTFFIRAQNDGDAADGLFVDGCAGGSGFIVRYFAGASGDTEITRAVVDGDYRLSNVAPAATRTLRAVVTVRDSADVGAVKTCAVAITSVVRGNTDVVRARVTAAS